MNISNNLKKNPAFPYLERLNIILKIHNRYDIICLETFFMHKRAQVLTVQHILSC